MSDKYNIFKVYVPIVASIIAVIVAFYLNKQHSNETHLEESIYSLTKNKIITETKIDYINNIIKKIEINQNTLSDSFSIWKQRYAKIDFVVLVTDKLDKKFNDKMSRFGNVMYSDRQELFYLIYNNTENIQYLYGKLNLDFNRKVIKPNSNKVRLPYARYDQNK